MVVAAGGLVWFGTRPGPAPNAGVREPAIVQTVYAENSVDAPTVAGQGGLPTRLLIPSAMIDTTVSEVGVVIQDGKPAWQTAWRSAGHHITSARPGQPGNLVLTGHVSVADRNNTPVFASLDAVQAGDTIEVHSGEKSYLYRVQSISVVAPSAVNLLKSGHASTITLITCTRDLKRRLVVVGTLESV
jgi:sortase A